MQWLRKLLSGSSTSVTKAPRPNAFCPKLETLDQRDVPSVSSVLTSTGDLFTLIVDNSNSVLTSFNGSAPTVAIQGTATTGVRTAQAFRTPGGGIGVDLVLLDGTWQHIELSGGGLLANVTGSTPVTAAQLPGTMAGSKILDVGTAYDSSGMARLDILVSNGTTSTALDQTGQIFEFNQGSGGLTASGSFTPLTPLGTNVRWISDYITTTGGTGLAFGQVFPATGTSTPELLDRKFDFTTGLTTLYDGNDQAGGGITEYSQTVAGTTSSGLLGVPGNILGIPSTTTNHNPRVVINITYDADTSTALTFDPTATYALTLDTGPAGGTAGINVTSTTGTNQVKPGG